MNIGHDSKAKIIFDQLQIACDDDELEHRRSFLVSFSTYPAQRQRRHVSHLFKYNNLG